MSASTPVDSVCATLQNQFVAILPRIETHARIFFRDVRCAVRKADCVAEAVAIAWRWFVRLVERGKDVARFVSALASLAARSVRAGRRACGGVRGNDVMSRIAQRRHGFRVEALPSPRTGMDELYATPRGQQVQDAYEERLRDNTRTPPPDQAAFRIDFRAWLATLTPRERTIIRHMLQNERTKDLAGTFQISPGRISQMRRDFCEDWRRFTGDDEGANGTP